MTANEKDQYKRDIEQAAMPFGFAFSNYGCMCSGGQLIYTACHGNHRYELDVWHARGYWHLFQDRYKIGYGTTRESLINQIQKLWDLDNL